MGLRAICCLVLLCLSLSAGAGCAPRPSRSTGAAPQGEPTVSRADPGFLQWLERQSLLGAAAPAAAIVSGSELGWRTAGLPPSPDALLAAADMWIDIQPRSLLTGSRRSPLAELAQPHALQALSQSGIKGMFIAPTAEAGAIWGYERAASTTGEDVTAHGLAEEVGTEDDFARLGNEAGKQRILLGGDLVPAATGLGPDFFLAARAVHDYPGLYCLIEIPHQNWPNLPEAEGEWRAIPLSPQHHDALAAKGLIPPRVARDELTWPSPGGWAATGEVRGADGTLRRWVYRYDRRPGFPVLNWNDPSATARRVLSASAIRQVGLRRLPLVRVRLAPLAGLEAAGPVPNLQPLPEAANSLGREIRRYGGWSWLHDVLPFAVLREIMPAGPDFVTDPASTTTAAHALLTGDAAPLRMTLDAALATGLDFRRFVHALPGSGGIDYTLPQFGDTATQPGLSGDVPGPVLRHAMNTAARQRISAWGDQAPMVSGVLQMNAPSLAALAAGLSPEEAARPEARPAIVRNHLLLATFLAAQPGLFMLPADNAAGTLPLTWERATLRRESWDQEMTARGAWNPLPQASASGMTQSGIPRAPVAYEPIAIQQAMPGSFMAGIARLADMRNQTGIARGTALARPATSGPGSVALLSRLPDGRGHLLTIANFSDAAVTERIPMSSLSAHNVQWSGYDLLDPAFSLQGASPQIPLGPRQCRVILLK